MNMGLKCTIATLVGQKPTVQFDRNKINLKTVSTMPDKVSANVAAVSTYKDASAILKKNFAGQEFRTGQEEQLLYKMYSFGKKKEQNDFGCPWT